MEVMLVRDGNTTQGVLPSRNEALPRSVALCVLVHLLSRVQGLRLKDYAGREQVAVVAQSTAHGPEGTRHTVPALFPEHCQGGNRVC